MKTRSKLIMIALAAVTVAAVTGFTAGRIVNRRNAKRQTEQAPSAVVLDDTDWGTRVEYSGKTYERKDALSTVLFLGIDSERVEDPLGNIGKGGRADTIILFVLDDKARTTTMLSVSRDTMMDVEVYSADGRFIYEGEMQLTMQYAFGDSARRSCWLMKKKVSELLYGIPIDGCMSMTTTGIEDIVQRMGGITLTMPEDYSMIDARYEKGATVTMDGKEAEHFIRYRDTEISGSNDTRMARQSWLIGELFHQLKANGGLSLLAQIVQEDPDYLETDVEAELIKKLSDYTLREETLKVPGETREGELHDEYYVDEEALKKLLIEMFYLPVKQ